MVDEVEDYRIIEVIYSSQYTTVYKTLDVKKNKNVLIKSLNTEFNNPINIARLKSKYELLKKLDSKYVIKAYDFVEFENRYSVVLEDFGAIPLAQYIHKHHIELKELLEIALQMAKCMAYMHSNQVMHRSINPFNIYYNSDEHIIKLLGFENSSEFSYETQDALNPNVFHEKLDYISPEQTGRMNRPIDYRTDFYSLGITLYELACSMLPFTSSDAADMVYFHIAKTPLPIHEKNPEIPFVVSQIILKLMEKMPEDRYKSAEGIVFDLQECLNQFEEKGRIVEFELGIHDQFDRFQIPKKIYGRDEEIKRLLNTFERVAKGTVEFVFVGGYSGIGKTALVNELHKPIMKEHGIFLYGKCDQYNKNTPYSALFNALDQLCTYILYESEAEVKKWKEKIVDAISNNGALLIEVIPRLQLIIGAQPQLMEESIVEIQNKFSVALQNLLRTISSQTRPIVFFIDDLQWIDTASLELFEKVLFDSRMKGLMFIFAYRENEVDTTHPLMRTIEKIKKEEGKVDFLHLANLKLDTVTEMICDVFNYHAEEATLLAKTVYEKTLGNPFYVIEFLKYCNEEKLLYYNVSEKKWIWKQSDIKNSQTSDNVVAFLIGKIKMLPEATKKLLLIAACIGNRFDINILSAISGKNLEHLNEDLKPAIANEMIYVLEKNSLHTQKIELMFCHDKFQQAAYLAISEENKKSIYKDIVSYYNKIEGLNNNFQLFLLAELYSKILDCINKEEVNKALYIFLQAAKAARLTSAFDTARKYLELVMAIAPEALKKDNVFMQPIYVEYHLVLFSLADFKEVDTTYSRIEKITENPLDLVDACCVQLISLSNRSQYKEAFLLGASLLEKLGVSYPEDNLEEAIEAEIEKFYLYMRKGNIDKLEQKELISSKKDNAIAKILNRITSASVFANPLASYWTVLVSVNLMVEKGVTNWALENSATIALALIPLRKDYYNGYKISKKLIAIIEKMGFKEELDRMYHAHSILNCHWFEPLETAIYYAHKAYKGNLENGEFEFSCFSFFTSQAGILECCNSISEMQVEVETAIAFASKTGNLYSLEAFISFKQLVKTLKGETYEHGKFNDDTFQEEKHLKDIQNNGIALCYYYIYRSLSSLLFSEFKEAYRLTQKAALYLSHVPPAFYVVALHRFLTSLSICKCMEEEELIEEKQSMQKTLEENQEWMYQRAKDAPFNFQHLYNIVQAEMKALEGKYDEAFYLYEMAMLESEKNKRPYQYALICETIGQRYVKLGIKKTAGYYLKEAYASFLDWEAVGKVAYMKEKYKDILFPNFNSSYLKTKHNSLEGIDLNAIIQVSQAISGEIETKKLLEKLMEKIMQNSGSTMGHILLKDEKGLILFVSGCLSNNLELIIQHNEINLEQKHNKKMLPSSMINYVAMTKEALIVDNIFRSQFAYDSYFEKNSIQSAMCLPILQQSILKGIVYLENNILSGAFTKNNIEVLKIISSQAAISIENAFLYAKLENKVMESEKQISISKEYDRIKTEFFSNISHELRTPINVIFSAIQMHLFKLEGCQCNDISNDCFKYDYIMKQNCYRLLRLVNNLIDITKIDTGYFRVNKRNINLIGLIESITLSVASYIEDKGISLIFDTDIEEKIVACDPEKIERIILNLLSNALKFTPKGGHIEVDMEDGMENICIRVKDTGRGIPEEKRHLIFKRFVQVDKSFTRDHEGSGIGLSLVKDLVELHDGTINVKSSVGIGSEFIIHIPCKLVHEEVDEEESYEEVFKSRIEKINIEFSDIYK